jgi:hypothetical protein
MKQMNFMFRLVSHLPSNFVVGMQIFQNLEKKKKRSEIQNTSSPKQFRSWRFI